MASFVKISEKHWINFEHVSAVDFGTDTVTIYYTWQGVAGATVYPVHWEILTIGVDITAETVEMIREWFVTG